MIQIIPAIDIIDGKCVRLTKGDYDSSRVYDDNPVEIAKRFCDAGCRRIHVVDLDGARSSHIVNYRTLESIASKTSLDIDFGGGLKSDEDVRIAFDCGASMITGGSVAVKSPELFLGWLGRYGAQKVILGADVNGGKVATDGWLEQSEHDLLEFIKDYYEKGIRQIISTDISVDGTLSGPSVEMYRSMMSVLPDARIIASGGVSSLDDIMRLENAGVPAVIVGKAIYEGRITLKDLERIALC
ncbi:1-(5-phosphoribosyl)-5-[(5-phosphoribosylamino)methylideneamino]imidazole-4-carboxamide isomerase [Barnesiella sp. WM24]|uniref:1-(5-phosphoribosyl)-5-[(5- phosphoribosylamino)methylideneamino]imidazole-4- carboxamide isomerase n=1 Tax=Barnesiella sp. WM24 TaxID=2558278 RepID=UPI0010722C5D|nr:1-(5-phosphoribosyl)-5-[(5-phosphoribosylamino)methylideneamino]imidazole-4-carboxamide isomerase [Barnesiella sp. WM24]TFU92917.1 1-(5-phosphoribosyl)-5-[(5-phosphoribosylamino)methylideneamino]imidazole-4-carboxamide isomerase [Barnesiella sp. WM24]